MRHSNHHKNKHFNLYRTKHYNAYHHHKHRNYEPYKKTSVVSKIASRIKASFIRTFIDPTYGMTHGQKVYYYRSKEISEQHQHEIRLATINSNPTYRYKTDSRNISDINCHQTYENMNKPNRRVGLFNTNPGSSLPRSK